MAELIDVSNVNGSVDWNRVRRAGIAGAWLKATEGQTYIDKYFAQHRRDAARAGVRVGAYHFARPDLQPLTPEAEAINFCKVVGKLDRTDLRPVLDLEVAVREVLRRSEIEWWCREWSRTVKKRLGVWPLIYGSTSYLADMRLDQPILGGLWVANYGPNDGRRHTPGVPRPWRKAVAHQYTSRGRVDGVRGDVDRNYVPRLRAVLAFPWRGIVGRVSGGGKAARV